MKLINIFSLTFLLFTVLWGQSVTLVTPLDVSLQETSGLIYFNDRLISTDDEDDAAIHEIDSASGKITRSVIVSNATNVDWEDITIDEEFIYIGDIGNNFGTRESLKIYRIAISDYLNTTTDSVTADVINYSYADQTEFSSSLFSTNYDAEALVAVGGNLYVFTKNWGDRKTNIYAVPKEPGTYSVEQIGSLDARGLITGATYHEETDRLILSANSLPSPFILEIGDFSTGSFSETTLKRHKVQPPAGFSVQIEGLALKNEQSIYLTAEKNIAGKAALYVFDVPEAH